MATCPETVTVERDFCDLLDGNASRDAAREAMRYLMRGPGVYHPSPPLLGVTTVIVACTRDIGVQATDVREKILEFRSRWYRTEQRNEIIRRYGEGKRPVPELDWFIDKYRSLLEQRVVAEQTSSDYTVSFQGSAGLWQATFQVNCQGLSDGASVAVARRRRAADYDD